VKHPSGSETFLELRILWIVWIFGLFLNIQMIQVAEELVETVNGGEECVLVPRWFLPN